MMFLAALPTFQRLFPNFQTQCTTLYTILLPVAAVLLVTGLIAVVKHSQTPRSMVRPIVTTMMIVMAIALWGSWTDQAKEAFKTVVAKMDANPEQAAQLQSLDDEIANAASQAVVQDISNRNNDAKQQQARNEEIAAERHDALKKFGTMMVPDVNSDIRFGRSRQ